MTNLFTTASRLAIAGALVAVAGAAAPAAAQDTTLNVYNWSDYIGETTLDDFTNETGIEVVYDVYDSNEILEAKLFAGGTGYDIVVPTAMPNLQRQIQAELYQPLNKDQIPNWGLQDPVLLERVEAADPGNEFAAIYQWGTVGIGYNEAMIRERMPDAPVDSWDLMLDPEVLANFADCGVSILDSHNDVLPPVLNYLGLDPNSSAEEDLEAATALLETLRPHIRYFHSSQYINDLANGEICLAIGWSGDVYQAAYRAEEAENGHTITYTIPSEGTILWFDMLAIPADAPNPEAAHAFINFVLEPANMAEITNYVAYGNPIPASLEFVDPVIANDPGVFPPQEVKEALFSLTGVDPRTERDRTRAWTRMKTGY